MNDILQFSIDVEETDDIEERIVEALKEKGIIVEGINWKARWTNDGYHNGKEPISWD